MISQQLTIPVVSPSYSSWSEEYLKSLPLHDNITGLPNGILFQDHLRQTIALAKRYKNKPRVMFLDLDITNNKSSCEPHIINEIIKQVTKQLQKIRRESDTLAFLGIHGFAFIFNNILDEEDLSIIAERMMAFLDQSIYLGGQAYRPCFNIYLCTGIEEAMDTKNYPFEDYLIDYLLTHRKLVKTSDVEDREVF